MKESTSREKVLKAVRKALIRKSEADFSAADSEAEVYTTPEEDSLELLFAKNFSALAGNFIVCEKVVQTWVSGLWRHPVSGEASPCIQIYYHE